MNKFVYYIFVSFFLIACKETPSHVLPSPVDSPWEAEGWSNPVFLHLKKAEAYRANFQKDSAVLALLQAQHLLEQENKQELAARLYPKIMYETLDGNILSAQVDSCLAAWRPVLLENPHLIAQQTYYLADVFHWKYSDKDPDKQKQKAALDTLEMLLKKQYEPSIQSFYLDARLDFAIKEDLQEAVSLAQQLEPLLDSLTQALGRDVWRYATDFASNHAFYDYGNLEELAYAQGDYDKKIAITQKSLKILEQSENTDSLLIETAYLTLASAYRTKKEYEKALEYYQKCYPLISQKHPHAFSDCYLNEADIYATLNMPNEAIKCYNQSLRYNDLIPKEEESLYQNNRYFWAYVGLRDCHLEKGDSLKAQVYYDSLLLYKEESPKFFENEALTQAWKEKKYGQVLAAYQKSFDKVRARVNSDLHPSLSSSYAALAKAHLALGDTALALKTYNQALASLAPEHQGSVLAPIEMLSKRDEALRLGLARAQLLHASNQDTALLTQTQYAISLLNYLLNETDRPGDKAKFLNQSLLIYELGIEAALRNDQQVLAFQWAEQAKSVLLDEHLQDHRIRQSGMLPDSILAEERRLKQNLDFYENEWRRSKIAKQNEKAELQKNYVLQYRHSLDSLRQQLKNSHPNYFQLKYQQDLPDPQAIQNKLKDQQAWLSFFEGENHLYAFFLPKKGKLQVFITPLNKAYFTRFESLREALSQVAPENKNAAHFQQVSLDFTQNYLACFAQIPSEITQLVCAPDGRLSLLPLEALTLEQGPEKLNFANLPYLIHKFEFNYQYSLKLWWQGLENQQQKSKEILAFAASYDNANLAASHRGTPIQQNLRSQLLPLPGALEEITWLQNRFQGQFYLENQASEAQFKAEIAKKKPYAIMHLAMHGLLNSSEPLQSALAFTLGKDTLEDDFLYAYEILQQEIQADLVLLSACETGKGKLQRGEGVQSLGRSFFYAGASSLAMSLWPVNDQTTQIIIQNFYENLNQNQSQAQALHQAKKAYLKEIAGSQVEAAHPAFWAPFIHVGQDKPLKINEKSSLNTNALIGSLALVSLLGVYWFRKKKRA